MKKTGVLFFALILLISSFTYAQSNVSVNASNSSGNLSDNFSSGSGDIGEQIQHGKDFVEEQKYNFLATQWKDFFLRNKFIAPVNVFFEKINIVFVILFARDWSFSLEMLFVFMLWLFTLLSLGSYARAFLIKVGWQRFLFSLGGTIILAQARIFNYISKGAIKVIFYKSSTGWNIVMFILLMFAIYVYFAINKMVSKSIKAKKEQQKKALMEKRTESLEKFKEVVVKEAKSID